MFTTIKNRKFILHALNTGAPFGYYHRFLYADDQNNVVDIYNTTWELQPMQDANNQKIKISGDRNMFFPNYLVLQLLARIINFTGNTYLDANNLRKTYLGDYDVSLYPSTRILQSYSTLPHLRTHDKIWINDLATKGNPTYFIDLFNMQLWFAFLIVFMSIGLISTCTIIFLKKYSKMVLDHMNWFSLTMNQGAEEYSTFISRRLLLITTSIVTIIFHCAFGALMSSVLAVRYPDLPFSDVTSLLNLQSFTVCVLPYSPAMQQITYDISKIKQPAKINRKVCPNIFHTFNVTYNSMNISKITCPTTNVVFIGSGLCFLPKISEQCLLHPFHGKYFREYVSMVVNAGFRFKEQFNRGILQLRSTGALDYLQNDFDQRQLHTVCLKQLIATDPDIGVTFFQIRILLIFLLLSIIFSLAVLGFELIHNKIQ